MDSRSQVTLEALVVLLGFVVFVAVLVREQARLWQEIRARSPAVSQEWGAGKVFGKSRSVDANFTRWFR